MKCIYCSRYEHKRHKAVIEHEDGSADVCDCSRCDGNPIFTSNVATTAAELEANLARIAGVPAALATEPIYHAPISEHVEPVDEFAGMEPPPPHPQPFDRRRFRIAEDRPGVNKYAPWRCVRCRECNLPTWSRETEIRFLDDVMCEDCFFMIMETMTELRIKRENSRAA